MEFVSKLQISENVLRDINVKKNTAFFFKSLAVGDSTGPIKKKQVILHRSFIVFEYWTQ